MKKLLSLLLAAAMIAGMLPAAAGAQEVSPQGAQPEDLVQYVNPLIGTDNFKHNSEFAGLAPFVTAPFGMTNFTPQTRENGIGGISYQYEDSTISGFYASHQPAIWMGDYGYMNVMPQIGEVKPGAEDRKLPFSHDNETSTPYLYEVTMGERDRQITGAMTATERCAVYRFTFPETAQANILVESARDRGDGMATVDLERNEIYGWNSDNMSSHLNDDPPENLKGYFVVRFREAEATGSGVYEDYRVVELEPDAEPTGTGRKSGAYVTFDTTGDNGKVIEMVVGTSFVSVEQARTNLEREIGDRSFEDVADGLRSTWNEKLHIIEIEGATNDELNIFYTAMFHAMMFPRMFYETTAQGDDVYFSPYDDEYHQGRSYTDFSIWDTFRAQNSFLMLVEPERIDDMVTSLLQNYQEGGYMPKWPNPGYTNIMIGTHADSLVAEAIRKGLLDESKYDLAYDAVFKDAMAPQAGDGVIKWGDRQTGVPYEARGGLGSYKALGYVANGYATENVSRTMEFAYDDWCVAQVAKAVGKEDAYSYFMNRSLNYQNAISPDTGFATGRDPEGNWGGGQFTEGSSKKYTWFALHDPQGLRDYMAEHKGEDFYNTELEKAWTEGWLEQQNEPCHHYAYMFNFSGRPDLTQKYARETLVKSYSNDNAGMLGNDDCGQMSAWYIFSAMGFYPVNPASGEYMIGSPIFDKVTIHNPKEGTSFVITADNNDEDANFYIQSAQLNGGNLDVPMITHDQITAGGTLDFVMGSEASDWAADYRKDAIVYDEDAADIDDPFASKPFFGDSAVAREEKSLIGAAAIRVTDNDFLTGGDLGDPNESLKDGNLGFGFKVNTSADKLKNSPYYITMTWTEPKDMDALHIFSNAAKEQVPTLIDIEVTRDANPTDGSAWTTVLADQRLDWQTNEGSAEDMPVSFDRQTDVTGLRFRVKEANLMWGGFAIRELVIDDSQSMANTVDRANPGDMGFTVVYNHNELEGITLGSTALSEGEGYTVDAENGRIVVHAAAFAAAELGTHIPLRFHFDQGAAPTFYLTIREEGSILAHFSDNLGLKVANVEAPAGWPQDESPDKIVDGEHGHGYGYASKNNPAFPHDITLTFDENQRVDRLSIFSNYGASQGPTDVSILVTRDGRTWKEVVTNETYAWQTDDDDATEPFDIVFSAPEQSVKAIRFRINRANTVWGKVCIREIEIGSWSEMRVAPGEETDLTVALDMDRTELSKISDGAGDLAADTDYTLDGGTLTLKAAYLQTLAERGDTTLTLTAESGKTAQLKLILTYTVAFDSQGGSEVETVIEVSRGDTITAPADPDRNGYDFDGWYQDSECTQGWDFENDVVSEDLTLYAGWVENRHGSSPSNTTTKTEKNKDGSTTKTVTNKKTGGVTATTTYPDGTKIVATTPKDGETSIEVTVPKDKETVVVTIPTAAEPKPGEVAVIIKEDGTKEILKTSVATEDGMKVLLSESCKLEIMDNSKSFADVASDHWAAEAVQFVASRELFNGGDSGFLPAGEMSRGMLFTVLARLDGQETEGGSSWYSAAMDWAKETGISDGTNAESSITREQLAVMLYRYAVGRGLAPAADGVLTRFNDADEVSDWAFEAMNWAVQSGIITGSDNKLNPGGAATRAEVAVMLQRFISNMA